MKPLRIKIFHFLIVRRCLIAKYFYLQTELEAAKLFNYFDWRIYLLNFRALIILLYLLFNF